MPRGDAPRFAPRRTRVPTVVQSDEYPNDENYCPERNDDCADPATQAWHRKGVHERSLVAVKLTPLID